MAPARVAATSDVEATQTDAVRAAEERRLFLRIRRFGDRGARDHLVERFLLVERAADQLSGTLSRAPTAGDIARKLELSEEEVTEAFAVRYGYDALSLDRPQRDADGDEDLSLLDTLGEEESRYELIAYRESVAGTMRALPKREQDILRLRFVGDLTQTEIAERLGVSQMQVSRLLRRSLDRLRVVAEATEKGVP